MADFALDPDSDDQKLLTQVFGYYHRTFRGSQEALDFLRKRGITNGQVIDQFHLGYADRSLGLKLPSHHVKPGRDIRQRLQQVRLYRSSGHEHFSGCIVFPVFAADGSHRIVDAYGRKLLGKKLAARCPLDLHLNEQRHGVWNIEAFGATEEIILCTSVFDALLFWTHGYRNVTCTFGADALTDDHLTAFSEFQIRRVLTPSEMLGARLMEAGIECFRLHFPESLTAYTLAVTDPVDALGTILRRAEWLGKGQPAQQPTTTPIETKEEPMTLEPMEPDEVNTADDDADDDEEDWEVDIDELDEKEDADDPHQPARPAAKLKAETPAPEQTPVRLASPLPPAPREIEAEIKNDEVVMNIGHRRYRVRGLSKNLAYDTLKINLLASTETGMFVDTFDIYAARHRKAFISQAAAELGVEEQTVKKDLGRVLLKLEEFQDEMITRMTEPKEIHPKMTDDEKKAALHFLRDPNLLERIVTDFDVVGENTNKLMGYLAAVSRKLNQPLAIIIQSSSAAGKTALMEAVLSFVPPEDQVKYSAMTGQSLFYMGESNLKHKILAIVEEEGAERASYALKLLQSEGELMIASTAKDVGSGRLITQEYRVEGPVMIFLTTTAIKVDEELLNRCIVLTVDEDREQTKAIHRIQRRRQTLQGLLSSQDHRNTLALHRNAQRLLRPLLVVNPYAESLTFLDNKTRTRRDHLKYLTLIRAIALLHQYQRPVRAVEHQGKEVEYIEVTLEDIETANHLANEVLGRSVDDLPPQTRRLLTLIEEMVTAGCQQQGIDRSDYRFSRKDIRSATGWGHTQLKVHLKRLEELEHLLIHRGGRGQSFVYELLYEQPQQDSQKFLARLLNVDQLRRNLSGSDEEKSGAGRPEVGVMSAPCQAEHRDENAEQ